MDLVNERYGPRHNGRLLGLGPSEPTLSHFRLVCASHTRLFGRRVYSHPGAAALFPGFEPESAARPFLRIILRIRLVVLRHYVTILGSPTASRQNVVPVRQVRL